MDVRLVVDTELVVAKLKNADADMRDLTRLHRRVAKIVLDEWQSRVPVRSGRFKRGGRARGTQTKAFVDVDDAGPPYAGVAEFGGRIPRYHSSRKTLHKPPARSIGRDSYYLYPARDEKMERITKEYVEETQIILRKNGF